VTDTYQNPGYVFSQSDAQMSAVFGQTRYSATGWSNDNLVFGGGSDLHYCAGCNGSFMLDFSATSVASGGGVYGFGVDYYNRDAPGYSAFVTFADGSTKNFTLANTSALPISDFSTFFGLTSDLGIASVHFAYDGVATQDGWFAIDNLSIGSQGGGGGVPEPGVWALMVAGFALAGASLRRRALMA